MPSDETPALTLVESLRHWAEVERAQFGPTNNALLMGKAADEITRLASELETARTALEKLLPTSRLLLQNAEGCAANHYGADLETHGPPGWLADSANAIEVARAALSPPGGGAS